MARAPAKLPDVFRTSNNQVRAVVGLRRSAAAVQPIETVVYDGDTIQVNLLGSGSLRFLGIDTAELRLNNRLLDHPDWVARFGDPAILDVPGMEPGLRQHLLPRIGPDTAQNQLRHAIVGQQALQAMVTADIAAMNAVPDNFTLYIEFSYEVFDGNGRFLVFANRNQPDTNIGGPRLPSYNERMLAEGTALPFFIWPNVAPFRDFKSIIDAVPAPGSLAVLATGGKLGAARAMVKAARAAATAGDRTVFDPADPQILEAFELRFLQRRSLPSRGLIDLSRRTDLILRPQNYFKVPLPEDRLFIPPEFVPAFAARGWRLEGW